MKKHSYLLSIALLFAFTAPALVYAQGDQSAPAPQLKPNTITGHLQSEYQTGMQNLQNNRDYRNTLIPQGRYGSSSPAYASGTPPLMKRFASSTMFASSTLIQQMTMNHQHEQDLRADAFAFLQNNLVQQSNRSLTNLRQIRARISSLIQTETAKGLDMSKATTLLATADNDMAASDQAIQALAAYVPVANSVALSASTTVDLSRGRQLGKAAIDSIDTVRKDLDQTVKTIAAAMGVPPTGSTTKTMQP